jgi:cytochrome c-type biogenesis protein
MVEDLSLFLVFAAGLLSFLSPCVLPLIPSYLSILGGVGLGSKKRSEQRAFSSRPRLVITAAGFVLGFSAVFISLGILMSATFFLLGGILTYMNWVAGIIVIVLGINIFFDFLSFINYEKRPFFRQRMRGAPSKGGVRGVATAFVAGAAFAVGWTPCIGPILTSILFMAGQSGKAALAAAYLALYSVGLALPFLLAAVFFDKFLEYGKRFRSAMPFIRRISGILLIIIGLMILTGRYSALNILIQNQIFVYINWAETQALPFRLFADFLVWLQNF